MSPVLPYRILVPTDFSECAREALQAAVSLAEFKEGDIHLWHCRETGVALEDAERELSRLDELFPQTPFTRHLVEGDFMSALKKAWTELQPDIQIMGSHGASGKKEFFIGSKTQKVLRKIPLDMLVVKEPLVFRPGLRIVFASNFYADERARFKDVCDFFLPLDPHIHLLNISTSSLFDPPQSVVLQTMQQFQAEAGELDCTVHYIDEWSIESGIRYFSEQLSADLIVMTQSDANPLHRLLFGSRLEALVNHTHCAVLAQQKPESIN